MTPWVKTITILLGFTCIACDYFDGENERTPPRDLTVVEKSLVGSDNAFGVKLFQALSEAEPDSNLFISPLSISMALGMTLNGADGPTYEAMKSTLELQGLSEKDINESYQSLIELLTGLDPEVIFSIANSLWFKQGLPVYDEFVKTNQTYFNAEVDGLDFNSPEAVNTINEWVNHNTNGVIKKILDYIPPEMVMYLINAIYFKGNWRYEFDEKDTKEGVFYNEDGAEPVLPLMTREITVPIYQAADGAIIDLPYGDSLFSMTIFLPNGNINNFGKQLTLEKFDQYINHLSSNTFHLTLPKFSLKWEKNLNEILSELGMEIAFDPSKANFSRIMPLNGHENLFISEVKHKTYIKVDEEGTEAAAVTSVGIGITSAPPNIVINRPFILAIRENHSGTILFIGKILNLK